MKMTTTTPLDITGPTYALWSYGDGSYRMTTTEVAAMRKLNKIAKAYQGSPFVEGDEPVFKISETQLVEALTVTLGLRGTRRLLKEHGLTWLQGRRRVVKHVVEQAAL